MIRTHSRHWETPKYGNVKTKGFDSKKEARRAAELSVLQACRAISDLKFQVKYEVIPKQDGERAAHYIADFEYVENGERITEDCKGFKTPDYILKRKLMLKVHGIKIKET